MARCLVTFNSNPELREQLGWKLFMSKFSSDLKKTFRKGANPPEASLIVKQIINEMLPDFVGDEYTLDDALETMNNNSNRRTLDNAFGDLLLLREAINPKVDTSTIPYYDPDFHISREVVKHLQDLIAGNVSNAVAQVEKETALNDNVIIDPLTIGKYDDLIHERNYGDLSAYRAERFKNSSSAENITVSKFINNVLLKNAFIDTDRRVLVNQKQVPGEPFEVDANLRKYRKELLADLLTRVPLANENGLIQFDETLLDNKPFANILRLLADKVSNVTYKNNKVSLNAAGTLSEVTEEYKRTGHPDLKAIVDNFTDFVILSDFDRLFDYYGAGAISVNKAAQNFESEQRKYSTKNVLSVDAINAAWDEKVQNGVELSAPFYKTLISNTRIISWNDGKETAEFLYPTLVTKTFVPFFNTIDRFDIKNSLRKHIVDALNSKTGLARTDKDVLFTMYKRFFESSTDAKLNLPANNQYAKENKVISFHNTILDNQDQSLMQLLIKPVTEISEAQYVEAVQGKTGAELTNSNFKNETATTFTASGNIERSINKSATDLYHVSDNDEDKGFVNKYDFRTDGAGNFSIVSPVDKTLYKFNASGGMPYDLETIKMLSKDLLGLNFDIARSGRPVNGRHYEFYQELRSMAPEGKELPNVFLSYIFDALKVISAKQEMADPKAVAKMMENMRNGKDISTNKLIQDAFRQDQYFSITNPEYKFKLLSQSAKVINRLIFNSENRYTGNRFKSTIRTVDDTSVAAFSNYTYYFGYKQNDNLHRLERNSVGKLPFNRQPFAQNPIALDPDFLNRFYIRGSAKIGDVIKSNSSQNDLETLSFNINLGYFGRLKQNIDDNNVIDAIFDPTVYSDKSTNPLPSINNTLNLPNGSMKVFVEDNGQAVDEKKILRLQYASSGQYYKAYAHNILDTWSGVINAVPEEIGTKERLQLTTDMSKTKSPSARLKLMNDFNAKFWYDNEFEHGLKGYEAARFFADQSGHSLVNWIHFQNDKKSLSTDPKKGTQLTIKPALIDNVALYENETVSAGFVDKLNTQLVKFAKTLNGYGFKFDDNAASIIKRLYPKMDDKYLDTEGKPKVSTQAEPTKAEHVNPALRKMFYDFNMVQDAVMLNKLGPIYAHKGKDENKMMITQDKRNVAATASVRNYSLGLERGVEDETNTAFVDDLVSYSKTILGDKPEIVDFDGASWETMVQRLKTYESLNARFNGDGGIVHKSFISHFDPHTGTFGETKHAAFALTNDVIRNTIGANIDLMELHRDLYRADISKVDITKSWKDGVNLSTFNDGEVMYYDRGINTENGLMGTLYQLDSITYKGKDAEGNSQYIVNTRNLTMDPDKIITQVKSINTFFDLWKTLGSIDSVEVTDLPSKHFYFKGNRKVYLKDNTRSAEKLLDFESYIGNKGETMIPERYISGGKDSVKRGYAVYKQIFNGKGLVSSHVDLVKEFMGKTSDPVTVNALKVKLSQVDAKVDARTFLGLVSDEDNVADLEDLHNEAIDHVDNGVTYFKNVTRPYQRFKGKNVDRISHAGAQKVGQFNLNNIETMKLDDRAKWYEQHKIEVTANKDRKTTDEIYDRAQKQALSEYFDDHDVFYIDVPIGTTMKEYEKISQLVHDEGDQEAINQYQKRIRTLEDFTRAEQLEKNLDTNIMYTEDGDTDADSLRKEAEEYATQLSGDDVDTDKWQEGSSFKQFIDDHIKGKIDPEFQANANRLIDGYNLKDLLKDPNQLDIFQQNAATPVIPGINKLMTHGISNFNAGIQLSAWHETEGAIVTSPTQMLNAFIFNAKKLGKVDQMYSAIGNIVDQELSYAFGDSEIVDPDLQGSNPYALDIPKTIRGLRDHYERNKDYLLKVFKDILERKVETADEFTLENLIVEMFNHNDLPVDDPQMFGSAIAELTNYFTKTGIRTKFDGMFAVLQPASNMLQFHDVSGGFLPIKNAQGGFTPRKLAPGEKMVLPLFEFKQYEKLNLAYREHSDPAVAAHAKTAKQITEKPRNLKGQQVQIVYADGTSEDLSILSTDKNHLIPEAIGLDYVKTKVDTFKDHLQGGEYGKLNQTDKLKFLESNYRKFLKEFDTLADNHDHVAHPFLTAINDFHKVADKKVDKHYLEFFYDEFSQSKDWRDAKIAELKKAGKTKELIYAKENEYLDRLNTVAKLYIGQLQNFLDTADKGQVPESLKNSKLFGNHAKAEGAKIVVSRAEAIAPITAKKNFLLREGDTMSDVDANFFRDRLIDQLDYFDVDADAVIISSNNKRIFLHEGNVPDGQHIADHPQVQQGRDRNKWFTDESGNQLFKIPSGMQLVEMNGQLHAYVGTHSVLENQLVKNLQIRLGGSGREREKFEVHVLGDAIQRSASKALKVAEAEQRAQEMYSSWQMYVNKLIGTRVPGQHFQSFQGMKIVGFSEGNNIHVANEVILLSGADYDIDKQNIIYHSIDDDGRMALWHPASKLGSIEDLSKSMKLPMPSRKTAADFTAETDSIGGLLDATFGIDDDTDMTNLDALLEVYKNIENGFKLDATKNPNVIAALAAYEQGKDLNGINYGVSIKSVKNFAIANSNDIIESPSNFLYLSNGVTTDGVKQFSNRSLKAEMAAAARKEDPAARAQAKGANMVGKADIGIMASAGLKAQSAITFATNKTLDLISKMYDKYDIIDEQLERYKLELQTIQDPNGHYAGTNNEQSLTKVIGELTQKLSAITSDVRYYADSIGGVKLTLPNLNYDLLSNQRFEHNSVFTELHRTSVKNYVRDNMKKSFAKFAAIFDPDIADTKSQLLSSATDNAKELDLGKINAQPEFMTMYPSGLLRGKSMEELTDTMTSAIGDMLLRNATKNVFDRSTSSNSTGDLLNQVKIMFTPGVPSEKVQQAAQRLLDNYNLDVESYANAVFKDTKTGELFKAEDLNTFNIVHYKPAQVSTILAKYLGINQGIPSNNWGMYSFATQLEDTVNSLLIKDKQNPWFNFKTFLDAVGKGDGSHRYYVSQTSRLFRNEGINYNPLYVLSTNPHFAKQLSAFNASNTMLRESSYRVSSIYDLVKKLKKIGYIYVTQNIKQKDFLEAEKFIESTIIQNFIASEARNNRKNQAERPVFFKGYESMDLTNEEDRAKFVKWVQTDFLDNISKAPSMRNNAFVQDLRIDQKNDSLMFDKVDFMKLQMDTTNVKSNVEQGPYRDAYVDGLKTIYKQGLTDLQHDSVDKQNNVFNVLFWYNLITNKNNITKNSYAKMLGDVMWSDNRSENVYSRLLLLKGKVGKSTNSNLYLDAEPGDDNFYRMDMGGISFNLMDLFKNYEIGQVTELDRLRPDDEDDYENSFDPTSYVSTDDLPDVGNDYDGGGVDFGGEAVSFDDPGLLAERDAEEEPHTLSISRVKQKGNPGTRVVIKQNKLDPQEFNIVKSNLTLPGSTEYSATIDPSIKYNPFVDNKPELQQTQLASFDFYKMSLTNLHDLLSTLSNVQDVQITYKDQNGVHVKEKFDKTKIYKC